MTDKKNRSGKLIWKLQENIIDETTSRYLAEFIQNKEILQTQSTQVRKFERSWSKWQGCKYSVFVNSGSSANLVILDALREINNWQQGDEIIVPAVTWPTGIASIIQLGLTPVFVDINLEDFSFDYSGIAEKITNRTRAIFVTHLLGIPADMQRIKKIVQGKNIEIIEDCCEAHGAHIGGEKVGNMGIASSFSYYWGHHMSTIEGGMICTNNPDVYTYALLKRSHGMIRELNLQDRIVFQKKYPDIDPRFLFVTSGFNVRSTEFHGVLGQKQLIKLDNFIAIRNRNYAHFSQMMHIFDSFFVPLPTNLGISSFCFPFLVRSAQMRTLLQKYLEKQGIETRPILSGNLLKQPFLKNYQSKEHFPNADFIHNHAFYIGNNQFVTKTRIQKLERILEQFIDQQNILLDK